MPSKPQLADAVQHRLGLKGEQGLADRGAVGGGALADGDLGGQALRGVHLLDGHHLGAVEDPQVDGLAALARHLEVVLGLQ